jgi:Zn-dependent M28 family amino/carboxypeptidase
VFVITSGENIARQFKDGFHEKYPFILFYLTEDVAEKIFTAEKLEKLNRKLKRKDRIIVKPLPCEVSVGLAADEESLRGQNVIGWISGTGSTRETIVISAHYDHLGIRDTAIYYGADDNASGTSAVMEIARIFNAAKKEGHGPKRNILFLNVSGEEKGLLGSSYFVANSPVQLSDIVANLNIDMIGRIDSIHDSTGVRHYVYIIGADKLSTDLHNINEEENNRGPRLSLDYKYNSNDDPNNFYRRSDHYNFAKRGIPVIFYFDGKHADYHTPEDTADKINLDLLSERTRLVFLTAWQLANRKDRIVVDKRTE